MIRIVCGLRCSQLDTEPKEVGRTNWVGKVHFGGTNFKELGVGIGWWWVYGLMIILCVIGDGNKMFLWSDVWIRDGALCVRYTRLFELTKTKKVFVCDMAFLGWRLDGDGW